ncbi:MAG: pantoate--beta-alanine ligase [Gemmatimonadaceae bacterium]|nr:pantoate--beta-alanine ligase [Gemmatimonadaceae bacterium]
MIIVRTVHELREHVETARRHGDRIGLVPTMGALHEGHLSLMRRAAVRCGFTIVSLFVNPAQFNDPRDLERYPRDESRDAELAASAGARLLFAPPAHEVYPAGFATTVDVAGITEPLEGAMRGPAHFRGVATVVAKLLNMVQPHEAFFGQKDAQQSLLIRRLVRDLDMPVVIDVCPTVREPDGLAMSSRNALLSVESRRRASAISRALFAVRDRAAAGEADVERALDTGRAVLREAGIEPEYFAAVNAETLATADQFDSDTLVAIAARLGDVRLIDNVIVPASVHHS